MPSKRRNAVDPLQLHGRRLRGARTARHGQVRGADPAKGLDRLGRCRRRGAARIPGAGVRARPSAAPPATGCLCPRTSWTRSPRYVGGDAPALSKMGGSDWASTKYKARKAVKEIAGELIRLYSARMASRGYAFGPGYSVAARAGGGVPVCGDAGPADHHQRGQGGHGAGNPDGPPGLRRRGLRQDRDRGAGRVQGGAGRQAGGRAGAHHAAGTAALSRPSANASPASRCGSSRCPASRPARKPRTPWRGCAAAPSTSSSAPTGCFPRTPQFKDLGLVIVDEEQRFGVEHKEALKKMRTNVDVLAMSATPIPRTLEMSLTGIRETSTLATPPEERHPVLTYVGAYTDKQASAAIRRELMREGQVFFVHNRVSSIERTAAQIQQLVPEARVAVAHGQMSEHRLEQIIVDFWEKRFDVLVCTTIIETGLDISNANTLIVDRADNYGLSQLHQLRGRVGRGRERAYAYFLYPFGQAAGRGGAGAAQGRRGPQRAGRRHAAGHEGPGDPRRRQPAGRRAVRPHPGRRLRPVHPAGGRGGGGLPRRGRRAARRDEDRAAGQRAPAARLRPGGAAAPGGVPEAGRSADRTRRSTRSGRN